MSVVKIRASSLGDLFDCPARWEAKNLLGMHMPSSAAAQLGTAIHASTAVYDQSKIEGSGIKASEAFAAAVDAIHRPETDVNWDESSPAEAESIAAGLHLKYCTKIAPTQEYAAVEVKCESLEISDLGIALTGTTDRIRKTDEGFGIADLKTGKTAVAADGTIKTHGHAYQLGVYELLAEKASGIAITAPARVIGLTTAKSDAAQRVEISSPIVGVRETLIGDPDWPGVLETAARVIHGGNFWGNPKSMLCNPKYCPKFGNCNYRK